MPCFVDSMTFPPPPPTYFKFSSEYSEYLGPNNAVLWYFICDPHAENTYQSMIRLRKERLEQKPCVQSALCKNSRFGAANGQKILVTPHLPISARCSARSGGETSNKKRSRRAPSSALRVTFVLRFSHFPTHLSCRGRCARGRRPPLSVAELGLGPMLE